MVGMHIQGRSPRTTQPLGSSGHTNHSTTLGSDSQTLYQSEVVKRELRVKAKLPLYLSIYGPTLTYGHQLWVVTGRMRSRVLSLTDG